eukprot:gene7923-7992_t
MFSLTEHPNAEASVFKLLKELNITIDPEIIIAEMERHPDYPSMLAISDVLNALNIKNDAFRIGVDDLYNVPYPFIIHTLSNGGEFVVVTSITENSISLSSEKLEKHRISTDEFKKIYGGVVLSAEPNEEYKRKNSLITQLTAIKTPLLVAVLLTLFKTAGLITSILLLVQSIDSNNPLVQVLCQNKGKTNCNAILSSKAAKVFDGLTWSEILVLLNIISLPYTFYSIYYQARVAKQWCVLCCTVQGLLWLELAPTGTIAFRSPLTMPGNVEANNVITMARIVFTARNSDDDIKTPVSRHLMALNDTSGKEKVKQALHDWYEQKQKNYEEWARVYPVHLNEANFFKLDKQNEWCQLAEATPVTWKDNCRNVQWADTEQPPALIPTVPAKKGELYKHLAVTAWAVHSTIWVVEFVNKMMERGYTYLKEKAYLHFDKPYYAAGDTIYFKAYVAL